MVIPDLVLERNWCDVVSCRKQSGCWPVMQVCSVGCLVVTAHTNTGEAEHTHKRTHTLMKGVHLPHIRGMSNIPWCSWVRSHPMQIQPATNQTAPTLPQAPGKLPFQSSRVCAAVNIQWGVCVLCVCVVAACKLKEGGSWTGCWSRQHQAKACSWQQPSAHSLGRTQWGCPVPN